MLTVKIYSFSYKKSGIPRDNTSNGGGFVFDCRYIENPGRYLEFVFLSGKDSKVRKFLDNNRQMQELLTCAHGIIVNAIENYKNREFTSLMVSFGCTGGQHRSVYAAEKLRSKLHDTYGKSIAIKLKHNDLP